MPSQRGGFSPSFRSAPSGGTRHNASSGMRLSVYYPWHNLYGQTLFCIKMRRGKKGSTYECEQASGQRIIIPTWMTDPVHCARFSPGSPLSSLQALAELRQFLDLLKEQSTKLSNSTNMEAEHELNSPFDPSTKSHLSSQTSGNQERTGTASSGISSSSTGQTQTNLGEE